MKLLYNLVFLFLVYFALSTKCFAQQASLDGPKLLYKKMQTKSLIVHSRGWGFNYRRGKHITGKMDGVYEFEFATIRHPKEVKVQNTIQGNNKSFVLGKLNFLSTLRLGYGLQKVIYAKEVPGAIEIRWHNYLGASIGLAKPIYLEVRQLSNDPFPLAPRSERYDPEIHRPAAILGRSSFFKGLSQTAFHPGVYYKSGLSFDFAQEDDRIRNIEVGAVTDFFIRPIEIMAYNPKTILIVSLYISFNWGNKTLN
jgi:hypothetical protein